MPILRSRVYNKSAMTSTLTNNLIIKILQYYDSMVARYLLYSYYIMSLYIIPLCTYCYGQCYHCQLLNCSLFTDTLLVIDNGALNIYHHFRYILLHGFSCVRFRDGNVLKWLCFSFYSKLGSANGFTCRSRGMKRGLCVDNTVLNFISISSGVKTPWRKRGGGTNIQIVNIYYISRIWSYIHFLPGNVFFYYIYDFF